MPEAISQHALRSPVCLAFKLRFRDILSLTKVTVLPQGSVHLANICCWEAILNQSRLLVTSIYYSDGHCWQERFINFLPSSALQAKELVGEGEGAASSSEE